MIDLSICIPTYNRSYHLNNCLNSIKLAKENSDLKIEVCISDNSSEENTEEVVKKYRSNFALNFNKNKKNLGMAQNILKVVSMAKGKFCWLLGNDDIVLNNSFNKFSDLLKNNFDVDFFYVNSYQLNLKEIINLDHPINPVNLNLKNLKKFSSYEKSEKLNFFELIDHKKSFEFIMSMFLCIFKRQIWEDNLNVIDKEKISDLQQYSNLHNTAPHSLIWARGFKNKIAYFSAEPFTANVHGPRSDDWGKLYPFIEGIRIPQILDNFRKEGLPFISYIKSKNFTMRRLIPSFIYMIKSRQVSNFKYVSIKRDLIYNLIYPMVYISVLILLFKKIVFFIKSLLKNKN
jgi:glycosyltransferase involved in cell wall biosynthesis